MISETHNVGFVSQALKSPDVISVLNKAFGRRNQRLKNKDFNDILKLLEPFIFPLPTVDALNQIYQRIPAVMLFEKSAESGAGLTNFRLGDDGQVAFDLVMLDDHFDIQKKDLDVCMQLLLRAALSMYCFENWQTSMPTSTLPS